MTTFHGRVVHRGGVPSLISKIGFTNVRRLKSGQYRLKCSAMSQPPSSFAVIPEGKHATETCLGLVVDGVDEDGEARHVLGRVPRWFMTVSSREIRGRFDHVVVSAWRRPTVKTLKQAKKKAEMKLGECDFFVQITWL